MPTLKEEILAGARATVDEEKKRTSDAFKSKIEAQRGVRGKITDRPAATFKDSEAIKKEDFTRKYKSLKSKGMETGAINPFILSADASSPTFENEGLASLDQNNIENLKFQDSEYIEQVKSAKDNPELIQKINESWDAKFTERLANQNVSRKKDAMQNMFDKSLTQSLKKLVVDKNNIVQNQKLSQAGLSSKTIAELSNGKRSYINSYINARITNWENEKGLFKDLQEAEKWAEQDYQDKVNAVFELTSGKGALAEVQLKTAEVNLAIAEGKQVEAAQLASLWGTPEENQVYSVEDFNTQLKPKFEALEVGKVPITRPWTGAPEDDPNGECGVVMNDIAFGGQKIYGDSYESKKKIINVYDPKAPMPGDHFISDRSDSQTNGHVGMVLSVNYEKGTMTLGDSNNGGKRLWGTRNVPIASNNESIRGYYRPSSEPILKSGVGLPADAQLMVNQSKTIKELDEKLENYPVFYQEKTRRVWTRDQEIKRLKTLEEMEVTGGNELFLDEIKSEGNEKEFGALADAVSVRDNINQMRFWKDKVGTGPLEVSRRFLQKGLLETEGSRIFTRLTSVSGESLIAKVAENNGRNSSDREFQRMKEFNPDVAKDDQAFLDEVSRVEGQYNSWLNSQMARYGFETEEQLRKAIGLKPAQDHFSLRTPQDITNPVHKDQLGEAMGSTMKEGFDALVYRTEIEFDLEGTSLRQRLFEGLPVTEPGYKNITWDEFDPVSDIIINSN